MTELFIELISLTACVVLVLCLYGVLLAKTKRNAATFSWDNYFHTCGIYQGFSHWTTVKSLIKKLRQ